MAEPDLVERRKYIFSLLDLTACKEEKCSRVHTFQNRGCVYINVRVGVDGGLSGKIPPEGATKSAAEVQSLHPLAKP